MTLLQKLRFLRKYAAIFVGSIFLLGCYMPVGPNVAGVSGSTAEDDPPLPFYSGPRMPVVVLPLGLSKDAAERYPKLRELAVGLGVHNILVDTLYQTGGFTLVEGKANVVKEIMKLQWAHASGIMSEETAIEHGRLTGAKYIVYGEVYDFGVSSHGATVGFVRRRTDTIHIGIQIRMVSIERGDYIPASGTGQSGLTSEQLLFFSEKERFRGSDVGTATRKAIRRAVTTLLERVQEGR